MLTIVGLLHASWAIGSTWPFADLTTLVRTVMGTPDLTGIPPAPLIRAAAIARVGSRAAVRRWARLVTVPAAGVLALRGIGGLISSGFFGDLVTSEYRPLDLMVYSPLCLLLALGLALLEWPGKPVD